MGLHNNWSLLLTQKKKKLCGKKKNQWRIMRSGDVDRRNQRRDLKGEDCGIKEKEEEEEEEEEDDESKKKKKIMRLFERRR